MSLSKEKLKDSFSDRIETDDLCQHILQFLSLGDRLKLECVSKQFQRTVFLSECLQYFGIPYNISGDYEKMKRLVKKYPKVNKIKFRKSVDSFYNQDFIEWIIKYCDNISHIKLEEEVIKERDQKKLFDKFGQQLISVEINSNNNWFPFNKTPNIEELRVDSIDSQLSQIQFNRLKRFCVENLLSEDLNSFELFIENNAKTLKHLEIRYGFYDNKSVERLLGIISKSTNLIHLCFFLYYRVFDKSLINYLKETAINCKQIKSIELYIKYNNEIISVLNEFKQLKRLELFILENPFNVFEQIIGDFYPFQDLKGLEGLTHFSIGSIIRPKFIKETILTDIDINFPKLQTLVINYPFIASEWTAQVLNQISSLETIKLSITNDEITPQIKSHLIQNCKKFKSFENIFNFLESSEESEESDSSDDQNSD